MWMPAQTTVAALGRRGERGGHEASDGREEEGGIERRGRRLVGPARPGATQGSRAKACERVSPGRVNAKTSRPSATRDLRDEVGRRAEAVEAEAGGTAGPSHRPGSR